MSPLRVTRSRKREATTRWVDGIQLDKRAGAWFTPDGLWYLERDEQPGGVGWWLRPVDENPVDPMADCELVATVTAGIRLLRERGDL